MIPTISYKNGVDVFNVPENTVDTELTDTANAQTKKIPVGDYLVNVISNWLKTLKEQCMIKGLRTEILIVFEAQTPVIKTPVMFNAVNPVKPSLLTMSIISAVPTMVFSQLEPVKTLFSE